MHCVGEGWRNVDVWGVEYEIIITMNMIDDAFVLLSQGTLGCHDDECTEGWYDGSDDGVK